MCITDPLEWGALPTRVLPPSVHVAAGFGCSHASRMVIVTEKRVGERNTLLHLSARTGFKVMTVATMQIMVDHYSISWGTGPRPRSERDVATLVVAWTLPHLSKEEVAQIVEQRILRQQTKLSSVVTEENMKVIEKEMGDLGADVDLQQSVAAEVEAAKRAARQLKLPKVKQTLPPAPSQPAPSSSSSAAPSAATQRVDRVPVPGKEMTLAEAREYVPTAKGCTLSIHADHRWMLVYRARAIFPRSHSAPFISGDAESMRRGLLQVLAWGWRAHKETTNEECPFDLGMPV